MLGLFNRARRAAPAMAANPDLATAKAMPEAHPIQLIVMLRLREGTLTPVPVTLPSDTPLSEILARASVAAFLRAPDMQAAQIDAITLRTTRPGPLLAARLAEFA